MADTGPRRIRIISFMPMVVVLMGVLTYVAVFAVSATAPRIALVIAILGLAIAFSTAMLKEGSTQD
jgi:hypothetical protein